MEVIIGMGSIAIVLVILLIRSWKQHKTDNSVICELKREIFNLTNTDPTFEFKEGNCAPTKIEEE